MKQRFILFAFMLSTAICAMSQGIPFRFTAQYENGAYHPFDTVLIENLSRGWTYALAYPDTTFVLGGGSSQGIDHVTSNGETGLKVYPNPFAGRTKTILQLSDGGNVKMHIIRVDGSIVTSYSGTLSAGSYQIGVQMSKPQVAFLCVETGGERHVAKLVNSTTGDADKIEVHQIASRAPQPKDPEPGDFEEGDTMKFTAISIIGNTRTMSEPVTEALVVGGEIVLVFTDNDNTTDYAFDENNASYSTFSVAGNKQVRFSRGNLQYQISTNTWRFAEHQYDHIGDLNTNVIDETYNGWIDLFAWGTSGWSASGATYYQPWDTATEGSLYGPLGSIDITGQYARADWGVYNAISNGGRLVGMWRTLSYDEWYYIFNTRNDAANKRGAAIINGVRGLVFLPDEWTDPTGLTFNTTMTSYGDNIYSIEQWNQMEVAGAIFLPASGYRLGSIVHDEYEVIGFYWSSSSASGLGNQNAVQQHAQVFDFDSIQIGHGDSPRYYGYSVRLVQDLEFEIGSPLLPVVATSPVCEITSNSAICGGKVLDGGGIAVTNRGVCWSTNPSPTIDDNHTSDGVGLREFNSTISGLTINTTYYVRAYATNSEGTSYGEEIEFITVPSTVGFDEDGASNALFSIASNNQVRFSRGNLQYQASTETWRFAEHQYEYIGIDNSNAESNYTGWIDLFGWGTSGWDNGSTCYQPWSTNTDNNDYYSGGDIVGNYANADWGVYNYISNGGNQSGLWRTLTYDEWNYLLFTRIASTVCGTSNARYAKATVNNVKGLIVLPDLFTMPSNLPSLTNINASEASFDGNTYTTEQWVQMESAGALFMPASGDRLGTTNHYTNSNGEYWSVTSNSDNFAGYMSFNNSVVGMFFYTKSYGQSVRLVKAISDIYDNTATLPSVSTLELTAIGGTSAICSGNVIDNGGLDFTVRGICWNTCSNPTINNSHTIEGTGIGTYSSTLNNLTPATTYYVRAYARNSVGIAYGDQLEFTTESISGGFNEIGATNSKFSVSAGRQVRFSRGNLQYQATTGTWKFAEHQYDVIGNENLNISETNDGWIDLFGWGTSGWNSGSTCYQPWDSRGGSTYYIHNSLTGDYSNADWGVFNAISNGGNEAGLWRTLTKEEMLYLFSGRTDASEKYGTATVGGVAGLILLPDTWILPEGLTFTPGVIGYENTYDIADWLEMEANGALFLPAEGERNGTNQIYNPNHGFYWTSTKSDYADYAYSLYFTGTNLEPNSQGYIFMGFSVRLVRDL